MHTDLTIEIIVLVDKESGASKVVYRSDFAPTAQPLDLYVAEKSRAIALYHQAAYADPVLAERLRNASMVYPGQPDERLILVGQLQGDLQPDVLTHVELSRAPLHLKGIPVDER